TELLKRDHMDLGVRVATNIPYLAEQFRRALDSWARILDFDWHADDSENCSIRLLDGEHGLFNPPTIVARSQMPGRLNFQGSIAFNPTRKLSGDELYRIALHEIGHIFGLQHSSNASSIMFFLDLDGLDWLDSKDLAQLAAHHKLRLASFERPVKI